MKSFKYFRKRILVATHDGPFHADDVFAVATIKIWAEQNGKRIKVIRTRDKEKLAKADFVVDVGGEYDPERNRFDHHQNGAPVRDNGIPYAAVGLVWKHYGEKICGNKEVADRVEKSLILSIDAKDTGTATMPSEKYPDLFDHLTSDVIFNFSPTWQESQSITFPQFKKALHFAKEILKREIKKAEAKVEGNKITRKVIEEQNFPDILVLENSVSHAEEVSKEKNIKFIVVKDSNNWVVKSARDNPNNFVDRAKMPESWWGLRDEELEDVSGIKDAFFCIKGGWFGKAKTLEAAMEMAKKSLQ